MEVQETTVKQKSEGVQWLSKLDFLWLEVTRKCNLRCVHCYTDSSAQLPLLGQMQYHDWRRVLKQAASLGCRAVQFIGGEPTLYPHLTRLIADARHFNYELIEIFTNGTLLNNSLLQTFRQFGIRLAFSVYTRNTEIHESITGKKGSFQKTMAGIRRALDYNLPIRAGIILMHENKKDPEKEIETMLAQMGVATVSVDRLRGVGRGDKLVPHESEFDELCGSCWKGKLRIDPDGCVSPCVFSGFYPVGNARTGLTSILNNTRLHDFRARVRELEIRRATCIPNFCSPDTCPPATRPCGPDCAPACSPCVPDIKK